VSKAIDNLLGEPKKEKSHKTEVGGRDVNCSNVCCKQGAVVVWRWVQQRR
jgi:hypothetical protein